MVVGVEVCGGRGGGVWEECGWRGGVARWEGWRCVGGIEECGWSDEVCCGRGEGVW